MIEGLSFMFHSLLFPGSKPSCIQTAVEDFWMIPKEFIS